MVTYLLRLHASCAKSGVVERGRPEVQVAKFSPNLKQADAHAAVAAVRSASRDKQFGYAAASAAGAELRMGGSAIGNESSLDLRQLAAPARDSVAASIWIRAPRASLVAVIARTGVTVAEAHAVLAQEIERLLGIKGYPVGIAFGVFVVAQALARGHASGLDDVGTAERIEKV